MAVRKTYVIEVDPTSGDRIEYEYDYSDRIWNVYAIDGLSGYPIESGYAGCRSELMWMIDNEVMNGLMTSKHVLMPVELMSFGAIGLISQNSNNYLGQSH